MKRAFLGATGTATGSKNLIEAVGGRILVDCGLCQGVKQLRLRNWEAFPVEPGSIDHPALPLREFQDSLGYPARVPEYRGTVELGS